MKTIKEKLADVLGRAAYVLGYDAATSSPQRKNLPWSRKAGRDEDSLLGARDRETIRQELLNLRRNDCITAAVCRTFADNVVGPGIYPQAKTSDPKWNKAAEDYFWEWSKVCDVRQRQNFREIQRTSVLARLLLGDTGFILTDGGQLQPVEFERVKTPDKLKTEANICEGFKLSPATGVTLGYYVYRRESDGRIDTSTDHYDYVASSNMILASNLFRFDQVRTIPDLACVTNNVKDLDDFSMSTLEKARLDAKQAWQIITEDGVGGPGNLGSRLSTATTGNGQQYESFNGVGNYYLRKGEEAKSLASNTPNAQYDSFTISHLRRIGAAIGIPYEFLLLDFSASNFSNARTGLMQVYNTVLDWQTWLDDKINQRVWNWRIAKAIKEKQLAPAPKVDGVSQWYQCEWVHPSRQWVDLQNQAQADLLNWQMGKDTITQMVRATGRDIEDVFAEKRIEIAFAQREAELLNQEYPTLALTWRDIISAQIPGQTQSKPEEKPIAKDEGVE